MASFRRFLPILLGQHLAQKPLDRRPEPSELTDSLDNVIQYDRVMGTKLIVAYCAGLEAIQRSRSDDINRALDLACGPGHYTLCLARYLGYQHVTGVDLAEPMVAVATQNAENQSFSERIHFRTGDAACLTDMPAGSFDLVSFTDAAHHFPDLDLVRKVFCEMDRAAASDGLVMIMDLVRLRTEAVTERYIHLLASDYIERGLPNFFEDFRNSMYAAWTADELWQAIPRDSRRWWWHIVPRGLPTIQIILGLPVGRRKPFVRPGFGVNDHPLIREWYPRWVAEIGKTWANATRFEWRMLRWSLKLARRRAIPPGK